MYLSLNKYWDLAQIHKKKEGILWNPRTPYQCNKSYNHILLLIFWRRTLMGNWLSQVRIVKSNRKLWKQMNKRSSKSQLYLKMKRLSRWQWSLLKRLLVNPPLLMEELLVSKQKIEIASDPFSIIITIPLQNSTYLFAYQLKELRHSSLFLNSLNLNRNKLFL